MGRFFRGVLALLLAVLVLAGCSAAPSPAPSGTSMPDMAGMDPPATGGGIALITTEARLADDFGQGVWSSISRFSGEAGVTGAVYKTEENDQDAAAATLKLAVAGGAQLAVAMDAAVSAAVLAEAHKYPEVDFIVLDTGAEAAPPNVTIVQYAAEQAGWLAGYVAGLECWWGVYGYVGTQGSYSQRYVLGYALGLNAAVGDMEKQEGGPFTSEVTGYSSDNVRLSGIALDSDTQADEAEEALAPLMADDGTFSPLSVLFIADQTLQPVAAALANQADALYMGIGLKLGTPGSGAVASVEYSADGLVYTALQQWKDGKFPGGQIVEGQLWDGALSLAVGSYSAESDLQANLDKALMAYGSGSVAAALARFVQAGEDGALPTMEELPLDNIHVAPPGPAAGQLPASSVVDSSASQAA